MTSFQYLREKIAQGRTSATPNKAPGWGLGGKTPAGFQPTPSGGSGGAAAPGQPPPAQGQINPLPGPGSTPTSSSLGISTKTPNAASLGIPGGSPFGKEGAFYALQQLGLIKQARVPFDVVNAGNPRFNKQPTAPAAQQAPPTQQGVGSKAVQTTMVPPVPKPSAGMFSGTQARNPNAGLQAGGQTNAAKGVSQYLP